MSRIYSDKKKVVEDCKTISIPFLKEHGYLDSNRSGCVTWRISSGEEISSIGVDSNFDLIPYIRINYKSMNYHTGQNTEYDYKVALTTTACNFGGVRHWFICPLCREGIPCHKRAAKLYLPPGHQYFACRHCYNLSYESRNLTRSGRMYELGQALSLIKTAEELYGNTTCWEYNGKLTKKASRYLTLNTKIEQQHNLLYG
jgi:hypothetical protein